MISLRFNQRRREMEGERELPQYLGMARHSAIAFEPHASLPQYSASRLKLEVKVRPFEGLGVFYSWPSSCEFQVSK